MMASATKSFSEDDLSCPVCCDLYKDPLLLPCTHSICSACLHRFWDSRAPQTPECPVCRSPCPGDKHPLNLALRNLCLSFLDGQGQGQGQGAEGGTNSSAGGAAGELCSLHGEKLKLFCLNDKQPACVVCRDSNKHTHHIFIPADEAGPQLKEAVRLNLEPLRRKLKTFEEQKTMLDDCALHIRVQAEKTEAQIREDFEKLHLFLRDEETARIAALREEEVQRSRVMKEKIEKMTKDVLSISFKISTIEEALRANDVLFLQNYKNTLDRAQCTLQDPERLSGALINVAKHLGNLKFRVWEKMQGIAQYTPVILDPNTAHPHLLLSPDLLSVHAIGERQPLPPIPQRPDLDPSILGHQALGPGMHSWEVEVPSQGDWLLGVLSESAQRRGDVHGRAGAWYLGHMGGTYSSSATPQPPTLLTLPQPPRTVRIQLDWDKGKVSFSDPEHNTHLHTFRHAFAERLFPYFNVGLSPLRILPTKTDVESHSPTHTLANAPAPQTHAPLQRRTEKRITDKFRRKSSSSSTLTE
ncbi:E3 ubiquitin-protein ligase TRIM35-like isoform X2 [Engraulis encrasicolus]|uniref:E3 ubiquitin-protein ligase TRIM35-like isoform X2 n=1 Tax=Engraulis encrasicolus TaxID=184585 RepID=UPI002FD47264